LQNLTGALQLIATIGVKVVVDGRRERRRSSDPGTRERICIAAARRQKRIRVLNSWQYGLRQGKMRCRSRRRSVELKPPRIGSQVQEPPNLLQRPERTVPRHFHGLREVDGFPSPALCGSFTNELYVRRRRVMIIRFRRGSIRENAHF
jgi:hypothetical protein